MTAPHAATAAEGGTSRAARIAILFGRVRVVMVTPVSGVTSFVCVLRGVLGVMPEPYPSQTR
jgi:hypothetical protein